MSRSVSRDSDYDDLEDLYDNLEIRDSGHDKSDHGEKERLLKTPLSPSDSMIVKSDIEYEDEYLQPDVKTQEQPFINQNTGQPTEPSDTYINLVPGESDTLYMNDLKNELADIGRKEIPGQLPEKPPGSYENFRGRSNHPTSTNHPRQIDYRGRVRARSMPAKSRRIKPEPKKSAGRDRKVRFGGIEVDGGESDADYLDDEGIYDTLPEIKAEKKPRRAWSLNLKRKKSKDR